MASWGTQELTLDKLAPERDALSEHEVAAVLAPLLERLRAGHAAGAAHGELTLTTVAIRIDEPTACFIHIYDTESWHTAAHRPAEVASCAHTRNGAGSIVQAADIWSIGVMALQLLLGRTFRCIYHDSVIVDPTTGEMPVLPVGTSWACIDFLQDCLEPRVARRASAAELLAHEFLSPFSDRATDVLAESLSDVLLISPEMKHKYPERQRGVPSLKGRAHDCGPALFGGTTFPCASCQCPYCGGHIPCHSQTWPVPLEEPRMRNISPQTVRAAPKRKCSEGHPPEKIPSKGVCSGLEQARHACLESSTHGSGVSVLREGPNTVASADASKVSHSCL
jgi:serine/threonine protein kinase